ncbi:Rrf2 family transcriptional regulator [Aquincola sp. S2]|uniref:Rrf2 family transcriptional regulator n=1 Tax=Pseudaquabacterium terrae TaxID=2732868 RepID=A0ABX2ER02_9BURK|nr:Rrf2 family transcriptional regulator [Aquabacterium terrae]NRF71033.1 Rrf2 family transcriptional regulator [Aquabacterium terrae]
MKLTAFTDYSLRVLIFLAAEPGRRATIAEIAAAFDMSENHLTKIVHFLGKQGWLTTIRGKGGGMALARPSDAVSIGQVVRDTEGAALPAECFEAGGGHCAIAGCCRLRGVLADAVQAFYATLDRCTLADLVRDQPSLVSVLNIGRPR